MPLTILNELIAKGSGMGAGGQLENARYEAYGPGGTAIIRDVITDSKTGRWRK